MKTVTTRECSKIAMVNGNELRSDTVIHDGVVKEWVGIGWIARRDPPTPEELEELPHVVD